ncbi:MAG: lactonase family protein [Lewinellaceae bacterium]|nr:lactonase family protein [Lewinellaceae bacterium]
MRYFIYFGFLMFLLGCKTTDDKQVADMTWPGGLLVGTYTRQEPHVQGKGMGMYIVSRDSLNGSLTLYDTLTGVVNPSFVWVNRENGLLLAVEETGAGVDTTGHIQSWYWDGQQAQFLSRQSSHGFAPCYVSTDEGARLVFAVNYVSGTITVLPLDTAGHLQPASQVIQLTGKGPTSRQEAPHPHAAVLSPDERYLYVPDLGTDHINIFSIDYANQRLEAAIPAQVTLNPGAGPRHLAFHPVLPYAYLMNELQSTVTTLSWDASNGQLDTLQTHSTLPAGFSGTSLGADIHLTPDGKFLYTSNRGDNSLAAFAVDLESGRLSPLGHTSTAGDFPRNFLISPKGDFLYAANQNSDNVVVFRIESSGALTQVGELAVPTPVCLQLLK